jgi:hypothetical protein
MVTLIFVLYKYTTISVAFRQTGHRFNMQISMNNYLTSKKDGKITFHTARNANGASAGLRFIAEI